jgi:adenylate kinase
MRISATLALDVHEDILVNRLLERGKGSGRADDQDAEKIRNRFAEYNQKTAPLIDYYAAQGKFHSINGEGSIESIAAQLTTIVAQL